MRQLVVVMSAVLLAGSLPTQAASGVSTLAETRGHPASRTAGGTHDPIQVRTLGVPDTARKHPPRAVPSGSPLAAQLPPRDTKGFRLVALTWKPGTAPDGVRAEVRTRDENGWSGWTELAWEPDEGPSPAEAATNVRDGTEPLWVGDADGVQARVSSDSGEAPRDLRVDMIDPGTPARTAAAAPPASYAAQPGASNEIGTSAKPSAPFSRRPAIVSRTRWGADPSLTEPCSAPVNGRTVRMVFVHHTVNTNKYSRDEARALVRSIYAYHTKSRGWCDIGYNFLVDRFGTKYEGRRGGYNTPRRGAHIAGYNTDTVGVAALGNFEETKPTGKMRNALRRLVAWKLASYYRNPAGRLTLNGNRLHVISGHRDAGSTLCPGKHLYRWLPKLRRRVDKTMAKTETPIYRKWRQVGRKTLGPPFRGEVGVVNGGRRTTFDKGRIFWKDGAGAHILQGRFNGRYKKTGGPAGPLGYPVNDAHDINVPRGRLQRFEGGRIYFHPSIGPRALWNGAILRRYLREGGAPGRLGMPVRQIREVRGGTAATFRNGRIEWHRDTESTTVTYK